MATEAWLLERATIGEGDEVPNSLAARILSLQSEIGSGDVAEILEEVLDIENHIHNVERWRGKLAVQTATAWADDTLSPFQTISGNNAYGSDPGDEAQVLGTADTPIQVGKTKFDMHTLLIVDSSSDTTSKIRIVFGSGTMADAILAGQFSETMFHLDTIGGQAPHAPVEIKMPRLDAGVQVWVQHWNASNNASIDFLVGIHEYNV